MTTAKSTFNTTDIVKERVLKTDNTEKTAAVNTDKFEYGSIESEITYSPKFVEKNEKAANRAAIGQSTATTDFQLQNIPLLLATKMAGLSTNADGTPKINSNGEYQRLLAAQNIIRGNHPKLSVNRSYCYSQQGYSYGNPNPRESCDTFAFATALSIKYGKSITPSDIKTGSGGFVMDHWVNNDDPVLKWKYDSDGNGSYDGTAYRIYSSSSSGENTLEGIDAQLQLGNPVLIHATGRNSAGAQSEHWATVIGKENGRYKIIDPWDGSERWLEDMEIYKNGGSIQDYVILSNKY